MICHVCSHSMTNCVCQTPSKQSMVELLANDNLRRVRLRPAAPVPVCDLYFYPTDNPTAPTLRIKKSSTEQGYLFQCLDAQMDIQVETYHVDMPDALMQVVRSMRGYGASQFRVEAF